MSSCVMWELWRLGICRLWRDRFKDLFPTLFLMSLGSSPSFFLCPNVEESQANEPLPSSRPFSFSCAWCNQRSLCRRKKGRCWKASLYSLWLILCSHEDWLRRQLAVFCIRMCLEIQKRAVAFWGGKSHLRTMCKGIAAGPEVQSACIGLQEDTCLSQRKGLPAIPFCLWGTTFYSPLCGQWKEHRLWFLGMVSTREKALTTSACV